MNLEQYLALKAQEESQQTTEATPDVPSTTEGQVDTTPAPKPTQEPETQPEQPETSVVINDDVEVEVNGEKLKVSELKQGYMRTADYTRKTQEVARQRKEAEEALRLLQQIRQTPGAAPIAPQPLDPVQAKVVELENKMYDMMLEREIEQLSNKYSDFNVVAVLETAQAKGITDLEDAYKLTIANKPPTPTAPSVDVEQIRREAYEKARKEIEEQIKATQTIVGPTDVKPVVVDESSQLTPAEINVALNMGISASEYLKWKNSGK